jgi:hypothetical protein
MDAWEKAIHFSPYIALDFQILLKSHQVSPGWSFVKRNFEDEDDYGTLPEQYWQQKANY